MCVLTSVMGGEKFFFSSTIWIFSLKREQCWVVCFGHKGLVHSKLFRTCYQLHSWYVLSSCFIFLFMLLQLKLVTLWILCRPSSWEWNKWLYIYSCWGWSKSAKNCGIDSFLLIATWLSCFRIIFPVFIFQMYLMELEGGHKSFWKIEL